MAGARRCCETGSASGRAPGRLPGCPGSRGPPRSTGRRHHTEEAILDSIRETAANVAIYRHHVNQLTLEVGDEIMLIDEEGHIKIEANAAIAGYTGSRTEPNKAAPHVFVVMHNEERDRLFNYAPTATKIEVSERMVRVAEKQGAKLVDILESVVPDLEAQLDSAASDPGAKGDRSSGRRGECHKPTLVVTLGEFPLAFASS